MKTRNCGNKSDRKQVWPLVPLRYFLPSVKIIFCGFHDAWNATTTVKTVSYTHSLDGNVGQAWITNLGGTWTPHMFVSVCVRARAFWSHLAARAGTKTTSHHENETDESEFPEKSLRRLGSSRTPAATSTTSCFHATTERSSERRFPLLTNSSHERVRVSVQAVTVGEFESSSICFPLMLFVNL